MPRLAKDYSKSIIYKLCCLDINVKDIYVGSTTCMRNRRYAHKFNCNSIKSKKYNGNVYTFIRDNGGWCNWSMIIIEE